VNNVAIGNTFDWSLAGAVPSNADAVYAHMQAYVAGGDQVLTIGVTSKLAGDFKYLWVAPATAGNMDMWLKFNGPQGDVLQYEVLQPSGGTAGTVQMFMYVAGYTTPSP
jgi:hypothetical protein